MNPNSLNVYVLFDHPRDYPNDVVLRAQCIDSKGKISVSPIVRKFHSIENAREWCELVGLWFCPRNPEDDPKIVGTYI